MHLGRDYQLDQLQIDVVNSLIFGAYNVLIIVRTGLGKSLTFQASILLTGLITIQIVLLNRLGEEQAYNINRICEETSNLVKAVNITTNSKKLDRRMFDNIVVGQIQYIILSLEQAASKEFRNVLRIQAVRDRISIVVIDEIYLIKAQAEFRAEYTQVSELRAILRNNTVWLGASTILDKETELYILENAGFRKQDDNDDYQTKVLRSSIDRTDTKYIFGVILKETLGITNYNYLAFVLRSSVDN